MTKYTKYLLLLIVFLAAVLLSSCEGKPPPMTETDAFQMDSRENIDVMVEHMDEVILEAKHGHNAINPFLTLQFKLSFRRIIVFNCQIQNNSEDVISFLLKRVELEYGARIDHAHNENFIMNYWEIYKEDEGLTDRDYRKKESTVKQYVMNDEYKIQPGSKIEGYFVFIDRFPQSGDAVLKIPVFTLNDELVAYFEFPYVFNIYQ